MKKQEFETARDMADKAERVEFVIMGDDIVPEEEVLVEAIEDLPEVIDENWLYGAYRDDRFEREKRRSDQ